MAKCLINGTNNNGANGVKIQIMNFFINKGFTPAMACAIVGNVKGESSFIPSNKNEIGCVGLFQWCYSRKDKLIAKYGQSGWKDVNNQLEFIWGELNGSWGYTEYKKVKDYFLSNTNRSVSDYCYYWLRWMETPSTNESDLRKNYLPTRMTAANEAAALYNQMNKGECNVDTSGGSDGSGSGSSSGTYTCDESTELESSVNVTEDSTSSASSSSSDGSSSESGNADTNTVDRRILFYGDKTAGDLFGDSSSPIINNCRMMTFRTSNASFTSIAPDIKKIMSNKNFKPKKVYFYVGSSMRWDSAKEIEREMEKICLSLSGYDVRFFCPVSASVNAYNSECQLNVLYKTITKVASETPKLGGVKSLYALPLTSAQNAVLDNSNRYRVRSGNKWVFTKAFCKYLSELVWSIIK